MEITPLMGLSMLALVMLLPIMFSLSNNRKQARTTYAAQTPSPIPSATPDAMTY